MAQEKLTVRGDMASALREYAKLLDANADLKRQLRDVRREAKGAKEGFGGMSQGLRQAKEVAMGLLGALGMAGGIAGAISKAVELTRQWQEHMRGLADQAAEAGREVTALAMMQEPGRIGGRVREAAAMGAFYGQRPGVSFGTIQAFQAKTGSFQGGMAAARSAFELAQLADVPLEGARGAVSVGMGLGLSPGDAARLAYAAGEASQLTPAELAQMAGTGLPAFLGVKGGAETGYGIAAGLSGLIKDPGQLGTYTRQVGTLLQQTTGKVGKTWRRLGFERPGQQPVEQLKALRAAGITTTGQLQEAGFAKKESLGLSILLGDLDAALAAMETTSRGFADEQIMFRKRTAAEAEVPQMAYARLAARKEAEHEVERKFGADSPLAMARDLYARRRGREIREQTFLGGQAGLGFLVDQEGRAGMTGNVASAVMESLDLYKRPWMALAGPYIGLRAGGRVLQHIFGSEAVEIETPGASGGLKIKVSVEDSRDQRAAKPAGGE